MAEIITLIPFKQKAEIHFCFVILTFNTPWFTNMLGILTILGEDLIFPCLEAEDLVPEDFPLKALAIV